MQFPTVNLIKSLKIKPNKKLGQCFLVDRNIAEKIFYSSDISPVDTIVEIGAGLGSLTFFFIKNAGKIISFEIDQHLFSILKDQFPKNSSVSLKNEDILESNFANFIENNKKLVVIGNIPYGLTTRLLLKLLQENSSIKKAVLMVQREFAQRLMADPATKDYGIFSVYARAYLNIEWLFDVPAQCFFPKPKVASTVLKIFPSNFRKWDAPGEKFFRQVVRASLSKRRKTLINSLKSFLADHNIDRVYFKELCAFKGIDLKRRGETLHLEEFNSLAAILKEILSKA